MMNNFDGEISIDSDSWSKSIHETVTGSHHFTIKGYDSTIGIGSGKFVRSDIFKVGGYDWSIHFYPDGKGPEDFRTYISVFIALDSEATDVRALFALTLMDQSGRGKHKVHSHFDRGLEKGPHTLKHRGNMWGYKRFFKKCDLQTSDYLKNDCLEMHCTVGVVRTRVVGPKSFEIQVPPSDIGKDMKQVFDSGFGTDISFRVGDETFKAHKFILASRSQVFKAQFSWNPSIDEVEVVDIEPTVFKLMLQYVYSDDLPDLCELSSCSTSPSGSTNILQHLLAAADRYGLDRLRMLCEAKLFEEMSADTVSTTLCLADQHHCLHLKSLCLEFAVANLEAVLHSEGFQYLKESCAWLMSDLLETCASGDHYLSLISSKKRSGSSVFGPDSAAADSVDANSRQVRSRS